MSATSHIRPFTHMDISSSDVAAGQQRPRLKGPAAASSRDVAQTLREIRGRGHGRPTGEAESFKTELCAIQDDEAVGLIGPGRRVVHIALEVSGLMAGPDLLHLSDVDCGEERG